MLITPARGGYRYSDDAKPRYVYALIFAGGRVYVGQSADPVARIRQHRRPASGWREAFDVLMLEQLDGPELMAIDREYAWRWSAHLAGLTPITLHDAYAFDLSWIRDSAKRLAEYRPWPSTT